MYWFFLALIPPFLWALVNSIDKFLLSKYLKAEGPGALIVFSSIAGILVLPIAYIIEPSIFNLTSSNILTLIIGGIFSSIALYLYFLALFDEDVTSVVPLLQLGPIFGFIIGFILLGETVSVYQLIVSLIIITGAFVISTKKTEEKTHIKTKLVFLMLGSSFFFALYDALFKYVAIDEKFWTSIFWQNIGLCIVGIFFIIFNRRYRDDFISLIRTNGTKILALNIINEILSLCGNVIFAFVTLLAPIGLVMTVGSYQPIFVLIVAIITSKLFLQKKLESLQPRIILGTVIIVAGSIALSL